MTEPAEGQLANLHLDEATGEKVSKSELKKRQKQRANEGKKKEKAAAAPPRAEKHISAEEEENNLTPNVRGLPPSRGLLPKILLLMYHSNILRYDLRRSRSSVKPRPQIHILTSSMLLQISENSSRSTTRSGLESIVRI